MKRISLRLSWKVGWVIWNKNITFWLFHWKALRRSCPLHKICTKKHSWSRSFLNQRHCLFQWTLVSLVKLNVSIRSACCLWHWPEKHQYYMMVAKMCHSQNRSNVDLHPGLIKAENPFRVESCFQDVMAKSANRQTDSSLKPNLCWQRGPAICFETLVQKAPIPLKA